MKTVKDAYEEHCGAWPEAWDGQYNKTKDYPALCWSNCRGRWYGVFLGDELLDVVCTKQQFIDYGNSLKDREMKGETVTFQGYELEVGKWYKANTFEAIFKGLSDDGWASFECSALKFICKDIEKVKELDAGKITKTKIIHEAGKVYKCRIKSGTAAYCTFEEIEEYIALFDDLEIICEMVEK